VSDAIELAAWRFLAQRRCPGLAVAHIEFIDGEEYAPEFTKTIVTPAVQLGFYESGVGHTFGEAAIALATKLGMPNAT